MSSGIYSITNKMTGKVYVGSAINLAQRWMDHRKTLRAQRHKNPHLQSAWNKYGEAAFEFVILKECAPEMLIEDEQAELDNRVAVVGWKNLYNLAPKAGSQLGFRHSDETKKKISEQQIGKKLTDEHRRKISEGNKGKHMSVQARINMSVARMGMKFSESHKNSLSIARRKWKQTPEQIKKTALARCGITHSKIECPYCLKLGGSNVMRRWHFDNCARKVGN